MIEIIRPATTWRDPLGPVELIHPSNPFDALPATGEQGRHFGRVRVTLSVGRATQERDALATGCSRPYLGPDPSMAQTPRSFL